MNKKNEKNYKRISVVGSCHNDVYSYVRVGDAWVSLCWCNVLYGCVLGIWFLFQCV